MFKIIKRHWLHHWEMFYSRNRWHLILDFSLLTIIIILACLVVGLNFYRPSTYLKNLTEMFTVNQPLDLSNPPLDLHADLVDSTVDFNKGTTLKLSFKNNSSYLISKFDIDFKVLTKNFLIDHLELINNDNPEVVIDKTKLIIPDLPANLNGQISLKVYFKNHDNDESDGKLINWQINSSYVVSGQSLKASFDLPLLNVASILKVDSRAYYNSPQGDQLGAGPLPPIINLPTNYWLFIEAKANGDFNNFIYSAKLPLGVEITGNQSILAGDFTYNKDLRQIVWRVPLIKAVASDYRAGFEVQFIPNSDQFDKVIPFFINAKYSAQEVSGAKRKISETDNSPDTNLEYDLINKDQGRIVK